MAAAGSVLSGCGGGNDGPSFNYGVASGDPLSDRIILWTHAKAPNSNANVELTYEVATDSAFTNIVSSGPAVAGAATGFTAKADATGLSPGQQYYYRFRSGLENSPVGRTRTLPSAGAESLKFAVMSCSNYPAGFFNVYAEVAKSDCDYALHLGDYIYEYAADGYASSLAASLGRVSVPANEITTLDHYRMRHAQYKSDVDSKVLHAAMPMIAVWDDHEVANDAYKNGAENHQDNEGDWEALMDETLNPKLGYNLDAWDGYLAARETLLGTALSLGKRLVTLAGDTHNAWHSNLTLKSDVPGLVPVGTKVGEEFATSSVSSPGFEGALSAIPSVQLEQIFTSVVDDLNYLNASGRGYLKMTFSAAQAKGEWFFVDTIASRTYSVTKGHEAVFQA